MGEDELELPVLAPWADEGLDGHGPLLPDEFLTGPQHYYQKEHQGCPDDGISKHSSGSLFFSFGPGFVLRCIFVRFLFPTGECFWSDFQLNYEPVPSFCLCHKGRRGPL